MLQNSLEYGNNLWDKGKGFRPLDRVVFFSGQARGLSRVFIAELDKKPVLKWHKDKHTQCNKLQQEFLTTTKN